MIQNALFLPEQEELLSAQDKASHGNAAESLVWGEPGKPWGAAAELARKGRGKGGEHTGFAVGKRDGSAKGEGGRICPDRYGCAEPVAVAGGRERGGIHRRYAFRDRPVPKNGGIGAAKGELILWPEPGTRR